MTKSRKWRNPYNTSFVKKDVETDFGLAIPVGTTGRPALLHSVKLMAKENTLKERKNIIKRYKHNKMGYPEKS